MRRGKKVQKGISRAEQQRQDSAAPWESSSSGTSLDSPLARPGQRHGQDVAGPSSGKSQLYERAFALSRSTSVRKRHDSFVSDTSEGADWDDSKSIDLHGSGSGVTRSQHDEEPHWGQQQQPHHKDEEDDGLGPRRFASQPAPGPSRQRESANLLGGAFRDSLASDISFNSITGENDRYSYAGDLRRRDSVDTVRSSEFGEDGRWGRAWANKAEDEESMYGDGESAWEGSEADRMSIMERDMDIDAGQGLRLGTLRGLSGLKALQASDDIGQDSQYERQNESVRARNHAASAATPQLHSATGRQHVVSLTPAMEISQRDAWRSSSAAGIDGSSDDPTQVEDETITFLGAGQRTSTTSTATARPRHRDSVDTIASGGAHVYVYPPSPAGSATSHLSSRAQSAQIQEQPAEALRSRWQGSAEQRLAQTPSLAAHASPPSAASPSSVLARPLNTPLVGPAARPRASGHPAGRPPPPEPRFGGYADPNKPLGGGGNGFIPPTSARARAIAAADGRESMISDLDVESLRLDGSSRRDSASTIRSDASSRMSVGTVRGWEEGAPSRPEQTQEKQDRISGRFHQRVGSAQSLQNQSAASAEAAQWQHNSRLRTTDLAPPRRASTQPTPPSPSMQERGLNRSNTHPHESSVIPPLQGEKRGSPVVGGAGATPAAQYQHQQQMLQRQQQQQPQQQGPGARPVPTTTAPTSSLAPPQRQPMRPTKSSATLGGSSMASTNSAGSSSSQSQSQNAEDFLTQGIAYHESGDLSRSAYYFERSAKVEGGCVVGMCMFGMALREGWGARKDPAKGFEWISRAAARAGEIMQSRDGMAKTEGELKAIRVRARIHHSLFSFSFSVSRPTH